MQIATLGIDIGKLWFHVVGLDATGKPVFRDNPAEAHALHRHLSAMSNWHMRQSRPRRHSTSSTAARDAPNRLR